MVLKIRMSCLQVVPHCKIFWTFHVFGSCAKLNLGRVVGLFDLIYTVYFDFNGVINMSLDSELRSEPPSPCPRSGRLKELLRYAADRDFVVWQRGTCRSRTEQRRLLSSLMELTVRQRRRGTCRSRTEQRRRLSSLMELTVLLPIFLRKRDEVSSFRTGTDTSKMAVWWGVNPWRSLAESKMLSFCLENTKSSRRPRLWVSNGLGQVENVYDIA